MKRIFAGLITLIFVLMSCAHYNIFDHSRAKADVYLDPSYSWINNSPTHGHATGLRAITVRVINKKYIDVRVKVRCEFKSDRALLGETVGMVKARNDKAMVIRGFARSPILVERAACFVASVR
jgi:hypothetical protein